MSDQPVYVLLGGTGGIGQALARTLAPTARLMLGARSSESLRDLAAETGAAAYTVDATHAEAVELVIQETVNQYGRVDGVVNLVGSILIKPAHQTSAAEFAETIALNLTSAFNTVKAAAPAMTDGGSIVLMASVASEYGLPNHEAIAAAKGGVSGLVRSAAATYAPKGVRVNALAPGLVRTPLSARLTRTEAQVQASARMHPLGRIGEPNDIAQAIAFLLDAQASGWITGQVLSVDGGLATIRSRG
ncbi:MAG: SDR family oxidoreductase [Rhodothermaceae bacterium]|nr:SDR family oxidoreductase [Rhodothermaceae bacterium]